jgi:hypothetical protein
LPQTCAAFASQINVEQNGGYLMEVFFWEILLMLGQNLFSDTFGSQGYLLQLALEL